jgi:glycosyltransferase involved in cell wall biosynthesis
MSAAFPEISLSVVFPAYNEAGNIDNTIPRAVASLRRMVGAFEIIVIDDCSQDDTHARAQALAAVHPELQVLRNERNLRQGGTLRRGFAAARYDLVTHNAMDYPFDFDDLPALLRHFPEADVVVAARKSYPGTTAPRRLVSWTNRALIRGLFGAAFHDYNFIQIYKREVLQAQRCFSQATSFITPEKILRACRDGRRVREVEVDYHQRLVGKPSSANWKNVRAALRDMGKLWVEFRAEDLRRLTGAGAPPTRRP